MSDVNLSQILKEVRELADKVEKLNSALVGDMLNKRPGLIQHVVTLMEDTYGENGNQGPNCLLTRQSKTEDEVAEIKDVLKRQKWTLSGMALAIGAGGGFMKDAIKHIFGG